MPAWYWGYDNGLLRSARNDDARSEVGSNTQCPQGIPVIAIHLRNDEARSRHCERSEAIYNKKENNNLWKSNS